MRKNVYGRKFSRDKNERQALFKGLLSALVLKGRIETTLQKAKAIKPSADKLITKARKGDNLAKRLLEKDLVPPAIDKLMKEVAQRFAKRSGGYTRIIKLGTRFSDNASTALIEWVEQENIKDQKLNIKNEKPKTKSPKAKVAKTKIDKVKKRQRRKLLRKGLVADI